MSEKNYHTDNNSFVIYKDWEELVLALGSDEERGRLFLALFSYAKNGKQPVDFSGALLMAFLIMKSAIERDGQKWEEVCAKRAISGSKGGAPKGNQNARKKQSKQPNGFQNNQKQPKQADNEKENENESENDSVSEKEKEKENDSVSPSAPDFSAVELSDDQLNSLFSFSSREHVEEYIEKARQWQIKNKRKYKNPYETIRQWIEQDKAKGSLPGEKQSSYDINDYEQFASNYDFSNAPWNRKGG